MTFNELYKDYSKLSYNIALQYLQNKEDAEEIVQDVFLSVYNNLHSFKQQSSYSTWIYKITINKSLDLIKSKQRKKRFAYIQSIFQTESNVLKYEGIEMNHPGILLEHKEELKVIFEAINSLKENQKTVIILHKIEKLSQVQIAEIMGISPKAVESLVQRAKSKLLYLLKENEG